MNALAWLEGPLSVRLLQTLLHFTWLGSAIAVLSVVMDLALQRASARTKYAVQVSALLLMLACLPVTFAFVSVPTVYKPAEFTAQDQPVAGMASAVPESAPPVSLDAGVVAERVAELSAVQTETESLATNSVRSGSTLGSDHDSGQIDLHVSATPVETDSSTLSTVWLVPYAPHFAAAYLAGVLVMNLRLLLALRGGHRLRQLAEPVTDPELLAIIRRQSQRIGLRMAPAIAYCRTISVPVVLGIVRPMILLPATLASGLSSEQLQALLTHELAHLRRLDPIVNLLQRLIEALLFFHPAVWYISCRIDTERENASDDLVLAAGFPRIQYADALVRMAELSASLRLKRFPLRAVTMAASGGSSSEFKRRVMRLIDGEATEFRLTRWGLGVLMLVLVIGTSSLALYPVWASAGLDQEPANPTAADNAPQVGLKIENFQLRDFLGAEHQLRDFSNSRLIVVAFLGADCPLAKLYGPRLSEIANKYKNQRITVLGINSNQQDTPTEIGQYVRRQGITFPMLKDPGNKIADQFGAERTPEVFLLDEQRIVRYRGGIDDQYGVGYSRPAPTQSFLVAAIDALLRGQPVKVSESKSVGCHVGRIVRKPPTGDITYSNQIARILQRRCMECHRDGGIGPFTMDSYAELAGWSETIRDVVAAGRMPPWHANPKYGQFSNDHRLPDEEKNMLLQWVENGIPEGNPADVPAAEQLVDGWNLGRPDLVVEMPTAFKVAANGVIPYQYFTVDPGFTEGKWVRASEVRPGVRSVVHHVIVFINPPGGDPILEEKGVGFEMVGGYVPGTPPMQLDPGVARYVPPGSTFVFQLHYTPDGKEQQDQTQIGLYFADPTSIRRSMQTGVAANLEFEIPAGAADHRVEAQHRFDHDTEIHALTPHMHFRGKSFRFEAIYPNGTREILLDVPRFDFNWQNTYRLVKPKLLPEGSMLKCYAVFDNSENNLSNPDATVPVKWGEQTWEEMMIGYVECVFLNQDLSLPEPQITPMGKDHYRVRFAYRPDRPVRSVNLAGTFNEWNTSSHPLEDPDHDGVFTMDVPLKSGPCRYKFVVDGNYWTHDPASRILTGFFHESFFVAGDDSNRVPTSRP